MGIYIIMQLSAHLRELTQLLLSQIMNDGCYAAFNRTRNTDTKLTERNFLLVDTLFREYLVLHRNYFFSGYHSCGLLTKLRVTLLINKWLANYGTLKYEFRQELTCFRWSTPSTFHWSWNSETEISGINYVHIIVILYKHNNRICTR